MKIRTCHTRICSVCVFSFFFPFLPCASSATLVIALTCGHVVSMMARNLSILSPLIIGSRVLLRAEDCDLVPATLLCIALYAFSLFSSFSFFLHVTSHFPSYLFRSAFVLYSWYTESRTPLGSPLFLSGAQSRSILIFILSVNLHVREAVDDDDDEEEEVDLMLKRIGKAAGPAASGSEGLRDSFSTHICPEPKRNSSASQTEISCSSNSRARTAFPFATEEQRRKKISSRFKLGCSRNRREESE